MAARHLTVRVRAGLAPDGVRLKANWPRGARGVIVLSRDEAVQLAADITGVVNAYDLLSGRQAQ